MSPTRFIAAICCSTLFLLTFVCKAQAISPFTDQGKVPQGKKVVPKNKQEMSIEELLGPPDVFPFLPDNHRDNSNPIGRIGPISSENL